MTLSFTGIWNVKKSKVNGLVNLKCVAQEPYFMLPEEHVCQKHFLPVDDSLVGSLYLQ